MAEKLKEIINNRIVGIMAFGNSIKELEKYIIELKNYDICWATLNAFPVMEDYILSKIDKQLDIVFDCSTVIESQIMKYEDLRLPRLDNFLARNYNNCWLTSYGITRDLKAMNRGSILEEYKDKIIIVDNIFPTDCIPYFMSVPNSITLLIGAMMYGKAKKIILFGYDGFNGFPEDAINSYYHPELAKKEQLIALGGYSDSNLNLGTHLFKKNFTRIYNDYRQLFGNVEIINCSFNSVYDNIRKIKYENLKEILDE